MKDIKVVNKRVKETWAGPGVTALDAEVQLIEKTEGGERKLYIHGNWSDDIRFTLAEKSYFDYMTRLSEENPGDVEYIEYFDALDDKYYDAACEWEENQEEQAEFDCEEYEEKSAADFMLEDVRKSEYAEYYLMAKELLDDYEEDIL